jgi:PAS domain S-box-containing protein
MIPSMSFGGDAVDLSRLSNDELAGALRNLQAPAPPSSQASQLEAAIHELNVHRCELEMHSRALRETRAALDEAVQLYADLYDHLPIAYLTLTPEGRITQANLAACHWLQRERSTVVGTFLRKYLDAFDSGRLAAHLEECASNGGSAQTELTLRRADGSSIAVQLLTRVAPSRTGERHLYTAISDITALKKTQKVLEAINREQETFNASISHDLRAPLITILNYAGIITEEHGAKLDDDARMMVERIGRAAGRMERTLRQLLDYGTMAREDVSLAPLTLEQFIRNVITEYRDTIAECRAEVTVECPPLKVIASPAMLGPVLTNLLTNALKFVEPGRQPAVRITAEADGDNVVIRVRDHGIGVDPKYHRQIFEVFHRLHGYSRYPGTGIGLAIARRGVEQMNGKIWVESEPGKGSCFCFSLPKA